MAKSKIPSRLSNVSVSTNHTVNGIHKLKKPKSKSAKSTKPKSNQIDTSKKDSKSKTIYFAAALFDLREVGINAILSDKLEQIGIHSNLP